MPVTPKEFCRNLQTIDERLDRVRQELIACPSLDAPQLIPILQEAAKILGTLRHDGKNARGDRSAQQWLKIVRQRAIRIKTLLDSAAGLQENVSRPLGMEVSYGPDGCLLASGHGGRISVQA